MSGELAVWTIDFVVLWLAVELLDPVARPRRASGMMWLPRSLIAVPFRLCPVVSFAGLMLCLTGRPTTAVTVAIILLTGVVVGSNVKRRVLGEPLLFTDFAIVGEMVRHPGFYLGAIPPIARAALVAVLALMVWLLVGNWTGDLLPRAVGLGLILSCWLVLDRLKHIGPWRHLMERPAMDADVARHGLIATLSLYWLRWREQPDPVPLPALGISHGLCPAELVVVVQCESFADPETLGATIAARMPELPGLARARGRASRWGKLAVSGFGAYTMRTEYGVLFGREEDSLGFRRFDPFLTATRDSSAALPMRLRNRIEHALFVHPHDLSFYGRDVLMPAVGFTRMLGLDAFKGASERGPHVSDTALGDQLETLIRTTVAPALIYAVTIENHGPWKPGRLAPGGTSLDAYLDHLCAGDALLDRLIDALDADGRRATLVFFGDHRPSIPGVIEPGADRDTPFVMLRFDAGETRSSRVEPERLTPAGLHHAILEAVYVS
ncbi:MAG: LTA synthase family protein [Janthinobacterium lividum]